MATREEHLYLLLDEIIMGSLFRNANGKLRFRYDDAYLQNGPGIPLSLSMPLVEREYEHDKVAPFLWGLLPDNDLLLERWASRFHVSASNPFALLNFRLHQEDMCQALSISPSLKYENMGGPGIVAIMELLNQSSSPKEDRDRFMQAIIFNYLILGSDAHAKNYSLLLGGEGRLRLAPLYDIASLLPYVPRPREQRLAMRIDRAYRDDQIRPHHFEKMAQQCEYPKQQLAKIMKEYLKKIPALSEKLCSELYQQGIRHPILRTLRDALHKRCRALSERNEF